jgi:hypothetical protein
MSEKQTFKVMLEKHEKNEACVITIPFDVKEVFGSKRVPVRGSINGASFRSTVFSMGGCYMMPVNKQMRDAANARAGDMITVEMERDTEPRVMEPTEDLAKALDENPKAKESWEKLSYTHKKEFVLVLEEAKKPETRARRLEKIIEELLTKYAKR